jgi:threonine dehydratase
VIPYRGGSLTAGIASAVKALRPQTRIVTAEPETAAALSAALDAGHPVTVDYCASFIDGCVPPRRQPGREAGTEPVNQRTSRPVTARPTTS